MDEREQLIAAIEHAEEVAQREGCTPCGEEHAQLAQWLRRLLELDFPPPSEESFTQEESNVVSLDEHRIRVEKEFEDETMAYMEAIWGKATFAFNVAIRDLEALHRGEAQDKALRPPQTDHEAIHMVLHCRDLANELARFFGLEDMIRPEDALKRKGVPRG